MQQPPSTLSPARLFRELLRVPRPRLPIRFQGTDLYVVALSSRELAELEHDVAILAACLTSRDGLPAVPNARWLESHLTSTGLARLSKQATEALQAIGPVWAAVDLGAWTATLKLGAQHPANYLDAYALGGCIDLVGSGEGTKLLPRPDRFFGVPMSQLVDGHWLAYRAARFIFEGNT